MAAVFFMVTMALYFAATVSFLTLLVRRADALSTFSLTITAVGFATHTVELLVLVASLVAGRDRLPALALAVIGTVQLALASSHRWVGGLHPLFAMVVLALAGAIATRAWRAR